MAQPQIKLTYFDIKGRAELARMIFNYGGIAFTDERISRDDFATLKPTLPLKQLPVLEVNGTIYAQSMAIVRYAANITGLYPNDAVEALKADMFSYALAELDAPLVDFLFKTPDETEKAKKKKVFIEEQVPTLFAALEKRVTGKFVTGDNLSFADFNLLDDVENKVKGAFPDFDMDKFPKLASVLANVKADPKVAAYLSKK
ncbi:unnamed protein product [Peronospora farinosa]|uniref:Glutathione S-transferase n=1 Tax=Peronospora farinosa TaxID=134698 RepID=A0AAV0UKK2_9STRA|nr:unnamed protein product [Peronospora farinosa]CAI5736305.1 unnamed protein product [Peronospora farinosa]